MKNLFKLTTAAGLALTLMGAPLAMAQPDQQHPGPQMANHFNDTKPAPQQHLQQQRPVQHQAMQHQPAQAPMRPAQGMSNHAPEQQHAQSAAPSHQWHNGDHFDGNRRVVSDWSRYHVRQPPAGYEWVQDGSQLVLISIASGVIADLVANAVYQ